jgi:hypothetical protein
MIRQTRGWMSSVVGPSSQKEPEEEPDSRSLANISAGAFQGSTAPC